MKTLERDMWQTACDHIEEECDLVLGADILTT
jgi:hypothetical protein